MNSILLDKTDPDIAKAVAGCEVGKPQTFSVTVTPVADTDTLLVGTIDSVEYEEPAEEETPEEEAPEEAASKPYKPKARKGSATAVEPMMM